MKSTGQISRGKSSKNLALLKDPINVAQGVCNSPDGTYTASQCSTPTPSACSYSSRLTATSRECATPRTPMSADTTWLEFPPNTNTYGAQDIQLHTNMLLPHSVDPGSGPVLSSQYRYLQGHMVDANDSLHFKLECASEDCRQRPFPSHEYHSYPQIPNYDQFSVYNPYTNILVNSTAGGYNQLVANCYASEPCHLAITPEPSPAPVVGDPATYQVAEEKSCQDIGEIPHQTAVDQMMSEEGRSSDEESISCELTEDVDSAPLVKSKTKPKRRRLRSRKLVGRIICPVCSRTFSRNSNFQGHMMTHDPHRPRYECIFPSCLVTFSRQAEILRHIQTVHLKLARFHCPCGGTFRRGDSLERHRLGKACPINRSIENETMDHRTQDEHTYFPSKYTIASGATDLTSLRVRDASTFSGPSRASQPLYLNRYPTSAQEDGETADA